MGLALKDTVDHKYADYLQGSGNDYELIDGEAYVMAPAPNVEHQEVVGEIFRKIANALVGKKCRAFVAPIDVRLPNQQEADEKIETVVQPDVLFVCDSNKLDRQGVRGAPDWVLEVLSPAATASHDQSKKRDLYERHGVREYWLVHLTDRVLTIYLLQGKEFAKPVMLELAGETAISVLDNVVIQWDDLLTRLPRAENIF